MVGNSAPGLGGICVGGSGNGAGGGGSFALVHPAPATRAAIPQTPRRRASCTQLTILGLWLPGINASRSMQSTRRPSRQVVRGGLLAGAGHGEGCLHAGHLGLAAGLVEALVQLLGAELELRLGRLVAFALGLDRLPA